MDMSLHEVGAAWPIEKRLAQRVVQKMIRLEIHLQPGGGNPDIR
jgi:hypothetical protein